MALKKEKRNTIIDIIKAIAIIMIVDVHIPGEYFFEIGQTYHVAVFLQLQECWRSPRKIRMIKYQ